jgi:hypothetical protein
MHTVYVVLGGVSEVVQARSLARFSPPPPRKPTTTSLEKTQNG